MGLREFSTEEIELIVYLASKEREHVEFSIVSEPDDKAVNVFRRRYIGTLDHLLGKITASIETIAVS